MFFVNIVREWCEKSLLGMLNLFGKEMFGVFLDEMENVVVGEKIIEDILNIIIWVSNFCFVIFLSFKFNIRSW